MAVVLVALSSALAYAVASVLQQRAAAGQPAERSLRPAIVLALAHQPLWLAGIAASGVGLCLQLLALDRGSLTVVQPLLVCGLVFALLINAVAVQHRGLTRREWAASLAVVGGVVLFVVAAGPGGGRSSATDRGWALVAVIFAAVVVLTVGTGGLLRGARRAVVLAAGAGVANAFSAAFTKALAHDAGAALRSGVGHTVSQLLTSWPLYALALSLAVVVVLVQSAFQAGPIGWSLPALTALNPVAAVVIGVTALHEHVELSLVACLGELAGLVLAAWGVLVLAASPAFATGRVTVAMRAAAPASPRA